MRDWIIGIAIVIAGLAVAWALTQATDRSRYELTSAGDLIAVLDTNTGQVQSFVKGPDAKYYVYVGADSRRAALERSQPAAK